MIRVRTLPSWVSGLVPALPATTPACALTASEYPPGGVLNLALGHHDHCPHPSPSRPGRRCRRHRLPEPAATVADCGRNHGPVPVAVEPDPTGRLLDGREAGVLSLHLGAGA